MKSGNDINGSVSVSSKTIPIDLLKQFKDEERKLKEEQRNLQTAVKNIKRDIDSQKDSLESYKRKQDALHEKRTAKAQEIRETYGYDPRSAVNEAFKFYQYESDSLQSSISIYNDGLSRSRDALYKNENKLNEINGILDLSLEERIDDDFDKLCSEKESAATESVFLELVKKFEEFGGYKGADKLVSECAEQARVAAAKEREAAEKALEEQYQALIRRKNNACTEEDYQNLAIQFLEMKGYADSIDLASECKNTAVKARYDRLVHAKNKASTVNEFLDLSEQFRGMNGFENTRELASECDNQYRVLKECREEQERLEREHRTAQEKKEREECEHREAEERERRGIEKAKETAKERRRKIVAISTKAVAVLFMVFVVILLYSTLKDIAGNEFWTNFLSMSIFAVVSFVLVLFLGSYSIISSIFLIASTAFSVYLSFISSIPGFTMIGISNLIALIMANLSNIEIGNVKEMWHGIARVFAVVFIAIAIVLMALFLGSYFTWFFLIISFLIVFLSWRDSLKLRVTFLIISIICSVVLFKSETVTYFQTTNALLSSLNERPVGAMSGISNLVAIFIAMICPKDD